MKSERLLIMTVARDTDGINGREGNIARAPLNQAAKSSAARASAREHVGKSRRALFHPRERGSTRPRPSGYRFVDSVGFRSPVPPGMPNPQSGIYGEESESSPGLSPASVTGLSATSDCLRVYVVQEACGVSLAPRKAESNFTG